MSTHSLRSISPSNSKKNSVCLGWHEGDYLEAIDNIIPILCEDLESYATICGVARSALLRDVLESILLDAPSARDRDDEYLQCIAAIRDWLLEDVDAVARSFGVRFSLVLVDVLRVIIQDTTLADNFVRELAIRVSREERPGPCVAPC